jgi:HAD superfamily hydrolase (TIGR01509 family)
MTDFSYKKLWIFDLQQTILNDYEAHLEAHKSILKEVGVDDLKVSVDEVIRLWGMRVFDVYKKILGDKFSDDKLQELVEKRDKKYIEIFSKSDPDLCKGVREIIDYLKSKKRLIAVVSGIRKELLEVGLTNARLINKVDFFVGADDVKHGKPHPEPFMKTVHHFGLKPEDCVAIGDSFLDAKGAKNAGIYSIGVLTGFTKREELIKSGAEMVIKNLEDLLKALKK